MLCIYADSLVLFEIQMPHIDALEIQLYRTVRSRVTIDPLVVVSLECKLLICCVVVDESTEPYVIG